MRKASNSRYTGLRRLGLRSNGRSGQALVETALVLPVLLLVIGGIVQFGMLFWTQNTLTQIARDTGRWAATQQVKPCADGDIALANQADLIAQQSSLLNFSIGDWASLGAYEYQVDPQPTEGVEVAWAGPPLLLPDDCPPIDNGQAWFVTIRVNHEVDVFFPGMAFVCGGGDSCHLSSAAQFRMEPAP